MRSLYRSWRSSWKSECLAAEVQTSWVDEYQARSSLGWLGPGNRVEGWTKAKAPSRTHRPSQNQTCSEICLSVVSWGQSSKCRAHIAHSLGGWHPQAEKGCWTTYPHPVSSSRIKRNTSGDELVRCAVDAATAYENILNAIRAAEDAASKATSASESALQVGTWSCTGFLDWLWRQLIFLLSYARNSVKNYLFKVRACYRYRLEFVLGMDHFCIYCLISRV